MPTISLNHTGSLHTGPTMHQHSTLSSSPPNFFSSSSSQRSQRRSVSSFDSRHHSSDDEDDDSPMNAPSLHQVLLNQGRGQYTLDNFGSFLQAQFCYENLGFWLASRQYKVGYSTHTHPLLQPISLLSLIRH
jgi:hypothetical protein